MMPRVSLVAFLITAFASTSGPLVAQTNENWEIVDSYPFAASQAVAADPASDAIYLGSGSGFIALDGSSEDPIPLDGTSLTDYRARCRGFVRDIKVTGDKVWVAAGVGGLQRWDRTTNDMDFAFTLVNDQDPPSSAWCLDVVHIGTSDFAVVGSNDLELDGRVFVIEVNSQDEVTQRDSVDLDAPIYSVAASSTLSTNKLSILVGKRCNYPGQVSGCESLLRYDADTTGSTPFTFPGTYLSWDLGCADPVMVRDIIIREDSTSKLAFVAASANGIRKFNLASGALTEVTSGGWPINVPGAGTGANEPRYRFDSLALYEQGGKHVLVAALGGAFKSERQYYCSLNTPVACDSETDPDPNMTGLYVFDLTDNPVTAPDGSIGVSLSDSSQLPVAPLSIDVRPDGTGQFLVDVSCDPKALAVVRATNGTHPEWALSRVGNWWADNSVYAEKIPGGSFDDVQVVQDPVSSDHYMLVGTEATLMSLGDTADSSFLHNFTGISATGAIPISRVSDEIATPPTVLYAYTPASSDTGSNAGKVRFYDLSAGAAQPDPSSGTIDVPARGYGSCLAPALDDGLWLYLATQADENTKIVGGEDPCGTGCATNPPRNEANGSIRVYRVTDSSGDQLPEPGTIATPLISSFLPSVCCYDSTKHGSFTDVYVKSASGGQAVWASYGASGEETGTGLIVLLAHLVDSALQLDFQEKVPFNTNLQGDKAARLTYDPDREILYAAHGTSGVAMYDVSDPLAPEQIGRFSWGQVDGNPMTSLQVWRGPGNYVYVSLLNWGVGIIDATDGDSFSEGFVLGSPFKLPATVMLSRMLPSWTTNCIRRGRQSTWLTV